MTLILVILIIVLFFYFYFRQGQFGRPPEGKRLARMRQSPNFKNGAFQNFSPTPSLTEGYSFWTVLYEFFFKKGERKRPTGIIPSRKTDLLHLDRQKDILVWFGHSSYFIQVDGIRLLVDPVLSGNASPLARSNRSFKGTDIYTADEMPESDFLFITHDHYDHADYDTLKRIRTKIGKVICGLGVGAHLERWGYDPGVICEADWNEMIELAPGFTAFAAPARHFSGRSFLRNKTLWLSYVLQTPSMKLYLGGDSGYDTHFADIGERFGPFDLAILDNGQYDIKWKYVHMQPLEVLQAAKDLKAKKVFPVHSAKFVMANHPWDEPLARITALNETYKIPLITPLIGEAVELKNEKQEFLKWWAGLT